MKLIIDSNRILSALIKNGAARKIINSDGLEFHTLDYVLEEVNRYKEYVCKKANMSEDNLDLLLGLIMEKIIIVTDEKIKNHIKEAMRIMKDIDINDSPILACALAIPNEGIWTEDKDLLRQNKVKIWKTKELLERI